MMLALAPFRREGLVMAFEKFHYTTSTGKQIALPKFDQIPFGVVRKLRKESENEQFFGLIEGVADKKSLDVIDSLPQSEIADLVTAWQKESGVSQGESSASST